MMFRSLSEIADEEPELTAKVRARQRYMAQLRLHPSPLDPDHPECPDDDEDDTPVAN